MVKERAYLITPYFDKRKFIEAENDKKEFESLADTAGVEITKSILLLLKRIDPAFYITKGKLQELTEEIKQNKINVVIINTELKPVQIRNLEEKFDCKVIGRTELILDIFAQRARTREAKIQVELAQLKYLLPRLTGLGKALSRLGGGVGTRGPGERKLEYDRRHILNRINTLQKKLKKIEKHRNLLLQNRKFKVVTLVGYTNAGKSTLLNTLAKEHLKTEDRLFVTLDPTIRKVYLGDNKYVLVSDTVGFIKNLPHHLVASFRATLSEVKYSDLILHVIDISENNIDEKIEVVNNVLLELQINPLNCIMVFNKIDKLDNKSKIERAQKLYPDRSVFISAKAGLNIDKLKKIILFKIEEKNNGI